jgi:hypothetical protein
MKNIHGYIISVFFVIGMTFIGMSEDKAFSDYKNTLGWLGGSICVTSFFSAIIKYF